MSESTLYQPADRWAAEPHEPPPPHRWRTRTVVLLVLLSLLLGSGLAYGVMQWQHRAVPSVQLPHGQLAVVLADPTQGHVVSDRVLIGVDGRSGAATDAALCPSGSVWKADPTNPATPQLCVFADGAVLARMGNQVVVALRMNDALRLATVQQSDIPLVVLPWQEAPVPAASDTGIQRMVEPQQ